jgi:hypothetical protein
LIFLYEFGIATLEIIFAAMTQRQPPALEYMLPALFDDRIDREHRSYVATISGTTLDTMGVFSGLANFSLARI